MGQEFVAAFGVYEQGARADFSCQYNVQTDTRFVMVYPNPKYDNGFNTVENTAFSWQNNLWDSHLKLPEELLANNSNYHQKCWERQDRLPNYLDTYASNNEWT
jgi:hypothetical protein